MPFKLKVLFSDSLLGDCSNVSAFFMPADIGIAQRTPQTKRGQVGVLADARIATRINLSMLLAKVKSA